MSNSAFQLKGSSFTLTVLQLKNVDPEVFSANLADLVTKTPNFFKNAPIVIDLNIVKNQSINFKKIVESIRFNGLIPVAVKSGSEDQNLAAGDAGLAVLNSNGESTSSKPNKKNANAVATSVIVTKPVRSGQQVYAKNSDLIVVAPVGHGSELLADGSIHVYGPLRGRALAGINGNTQARIFCHSLDADLIAIAGHYRVSDDLKEFKEKSHMQIFLEDDQLQFTSLV